VGALTHHVRYALTHPNSYDASEGGGAAQSSLVVVAPGDVSRIGGLDGRGARQRREEDVLILLHELVLALLRETRVLGRGARTAAEGW
jgi:hypothetical protein